VGKDMDKENITLYDLIDLDDSRKVLSEIQNIVSLIARGVDNTFIDQIYSDIVDLFNGQYPGYRASTAKYHNLEHTKAVVLATARLMHGHAQNENTFTPLNVEIGLAAALFHDIGYIQADYDLEGSGAKYTIGHEERSIAFMREYLSGKNFSFRDMSDCAHVIYCTMLATSPNAIPFRTKEIETLGKIVGSADLLAQIADRMYLERLLLLFLEFEEGGLPGFNSSLDLLQKTENFYEFVAQKRLNEEFDSFAADMRLHFLHHWDIDRDLYAESIEKNIEYIKTLNAECRGNFDCYLLNLKRGGIVERIFSKSE
jgi:hypothetical protein